ncbi:unannotated protein [freshwater metagenome]|uniref:Unannotated protein n=1 Tax=freshwater metagenome TaxID=449393 RepID=A0A6J7EKB5_9ZZZZ|nr:META domain-containing protein [Actinomycetota bacterium]
MRNVRHVVLAAIASAALAIAACGAGGPSPEGTWILDPAQSEATLNLEGGKVGGSNGCNMLIGAYKTDGDRLTFGELGSTLMACTGPGAALERRVMAGLRETRRFTSEGGRLVLRDDQGRALLSYRSPQPLTEGEWQASAIRTGDPVTSVLPATTLTLRLRSDGKAEGSGGCNTFGGEYELGDGELRFGPLAATERACLDSAATAQEQAYFSALEAARKFEQQGNTLTLRDERGDTVVNFRRSAD